jgi:rod shape-determining protein MreD
VSILNIVLLFLVALLAVFWQALFPGLRQLLGAQLDFLPPLMVYASLRAGLRVVSLLAIFSGLLFDSLSANPLGVSVLPLFIVGLAIHNYRDLILQDQLFAQLTLGLTAAAVTPLLTLLLLLTTGSTPLFGWGTLWQLFVMTLGGAICTPVVFELFKMLDRVFGHQQIGQTSFRPDREIRRGR